jgi:hypothetical protein
MTDFFVRRSCFVAIRRIPVRIVCSQCGQHAVIENGLKSLCFSANCMESQTAQAWRFCSEPTAVSNSNNVVLQYPRNN